MKKSVKIDLSWRAWSLIVGFFILIGFVGLSIAYNSGAAPSVMGHSLNEIELPSCDIGESLIKNSSGWGCGANDNSKTIETIYLIAESEVNGEGDIPGLLYEGNFNGGVEMQFIGSGDRISWGTIAFGIYIDDNPVVVGKEPYGAGSDYSTHAIVPLQHYANLTGNHIIKVKIISGSLKLSQYPASLLIKKY